MQTKMRGNANVYTIISIIFFKAYIELGEDIYVKTTETANKLITRTEIKLGCFQQYGYFNKN